MVLLLFGALTGMLIPTIQATSKSTNTVFAQEKNVTTVDFLSFEQQVEVVRIIHKIVCLVSISVACYQWWKAMKQKTSFGYQEYLILLRCVFISVASLMLSKIVFYIIKQNKANTTEDKGDNESSQSSDNVHRELVSVIKEEPNNPQKKVTRITLDEKNEAFLLENLNPMSCPLNDSTSNILWGCSLPAKNTVIISRTKSNVSRITCKATTQHNNQVIPSSSTSFDPPISDNNPDVTRNFISPNEYLTMQGTQYNNPINGTCTQQVTVDTYGLYVIPQLFGLKNQCTKAITEPWKKAINDPSLSCRQLIKTS